MNVFIKILFIGRTRYISVDEDETYGHIRKMISSNYNIDGKYIILIAFGKAKLNNEIIRHSDIYALLDRNILKDKRYIGRRFIIL